MTELSSIVLPLSKRERSRESDKSMDMINTDNHDSGNLLHSRTDRIRTVSITGDSNEAGYGFSLVQDMDFCCSGNRGRYTGEINQDGKPHGNGSFVRDRGGLTYVGQWNDGERIGNGNFFTVSGRHLGNVVWD